jgi:hypothetical protein
MAVYTVHAPPLKRYEPEPDPERFIFVRDGFSLWAFLLGPIWMLRHRMWLVLFGYILTVAAFEGLLNLLNIADSARVTVGIVLALLVGFEAPTLRRFTLARRRYGNVGIIVGDDLEVAERRFFDAWAKRGRLPLDASPQQGATFAGGVVGVPAERGAPS